jgi:DNA processing protein
VIHVLGDVGAATALEGDPGIAIVGARRASSYGVEVSRGLGRSLAATGATVLSGMALGVDSAAHAGALEAGGRSVAILGGGCDVPYPVAKRRLHGELAAGGALVSELPPGTHPRPWTFVARNRLIAALARTVVVVEATRHSGSLITARFARELGVDVAAVPGHITSALAQGTNDLLADGAQVVRDAQDVLDCAYGFGARQAPGPREQADPRLRPLFEQIAAGCDTVDALTASGADVRTVTTALAELELAGLVRRLPGGRYSVVA